MTIHAAIAIIITDDTDSEILSIEDLQDQKLSITELVNLLKLSIKCESYITSELEELLLSGNEKTKLIIWNEVTQHNWKTAYKIVSTWLEKIREAKK